MQHFTATLNQLYKNEKALWEQEDSWDTIEIIDADNTDDCVLSFIRKGKTKKDFLVIVLNLAPVERQNFAVGVPYPGTYTEVLNTEMKEFGGTWTKNNPDCVTENIPFKQFDHQIQTILPALGALIIRPQEVNTRKPAQKATTKKIKK